MLTKQLDKNQLAAFEALSKNKAVFIQGDSNSGKSHLLRHIIASWVLEGRNTLLVVEDDAAAIAAQRYFHKFGFNGDSALIKQLDLVDDKTKNELLISLTKKGKEDSLKNYDIFNQSLKSTENQLKTYYNKINVKTLFGKTWHELVVLQAFDKNSFPVLHFNQYIDPGRFDFTEEEFERLLEQIIQAFDYYNNGENLTETRFTDKAYTAESAKEAWRIIRDWIGDTRKRTSNIIIAISQFLHDKSRLKNQEFILKSKELKEKWELLELDIQNFQREAKIEENTKEGILTNFSSSTNKKKSLDKKKDLLIGRFAVLQGEMSFINELQGYVNEELEVSNIDVSTLLEMTKQEELKFLQINKLTHLFVNKNLKALNIHNASDPTLNGIEEEIGGLFEKLNDQDIVVQHFENTAFSLSKQLEQMEGLLQELNELQGQAERFVRFYRWNRFYISLDSTSKYFIDKIQIILPKNWISFFRNWYIQNYIQNSKNPFYQNVEALLVKYMASVDESVKLKYDAFKYENVEEIALLVENNKGFGKKLKKLLSSKSGDEDKLSWSTLLDEYPELLKKVFPVMILNYRELVKLPSTYYGFWDLIALDKKLFNDNERLFLSGFLRNATTKTLIAQEQPSISNEEISGLYDGILPLFPLNGYHQQNLIELAEMSHTERLYAARNLAHLLNDINQEIIIYHLGSSILFSCLSKPLNAVLEKLLDERNIKRMKVLETPIDLLVENFLELKGTKILITQDGLINNNVFDRIDWQIVVMERIRKAGIRITDFNSNDLLENPLKELLNFVKINLDVESRSK